MSSIGNSLSAVVRSTGAEPALQASLLRLKKYLSSQIVGQQRLIERLLIALLADGHLLVEGPDRKSVV